MLSLLDAIALLKNTPAARLTAAELTGLRQAAEKNPLIASAVGGSDALERYLAAAEQALADAAVPSISSPTELPEKAAPPEPPLPVHYGKQAALVAALLVLLATAASLYFSWKRNPPQLVTDRLPVANASSSSVKHAPDPAIQPTQPPDKQSQQAKSEFQHVQAGVLPTWQGWNVKQSSGAHVVEQIRWDLSDPLQARPQSLLEVTGGGAELFSDTQIDHRHWLRISLAEGTASQGGQIEVRADGQPIARFPLTKGGVYVVPLEFLRGKRVRLTIAHTPGKPPETIVWDTIRLVADKSGVAWTALKPSRAEATGGARLSIRPDDSVVVDGPNTPADHYAVTATIPNMNVRAVRIEALRDTSLPAGGPGRGAQGAFGLARLSASLTESDERHEQLIGRYVRVEQPTPGTAVTLSEVEVFSGGKNVALGKATVQTSVEGMAWGELAVDGKTNGLLSREETSVIRTRGSMPDMQWWEVDLGREYPLDRIVL